jgi:hypothetical protein
MGCFLTTRGSLGGRENDGEVAGSGDRRRRSSFNDGDGEHDWAHGKTVRRVGKLGGGEGRRSEALGALIYDRDGRGGGSQRAWPSMAMRP